MNERHLRANVELDEEFAATCEELDAHDAKLLYVFHPLVRLSRVPVFPIPDYDHLNPLPLTPLAKLMLPIGDNGLHHVDVYIQTVVEVVDTVRAAFHKLTGRAGTLIPRRLEKNLDQYLPPNSKARARGRWLAWMAWLAEGQPIMLQFTDDAEGGYWMGTIDEPFQCCRELLQVLRYPDVTARYPELGEFKARPIPTLADASDDRQASESQGGGKDNGSDKKQRLGRRDKQIKLLCKTKKLNGQWVKLANLANDDPIIKTLELNPVTKDVARNAVEPVERRRKSRR